MSGELERVVGSIVIQWGRIEAAMNALVAQLDHPARRTSKPWQWERRTDAWKELHRTSGSPDHVQEMERAWSKLVEARLVRDVLVHGEVHASTSPETNEPEVECLLASRHRTLLHAEYRRHYEAIRAVLPDVDRAVVERWVEGLEYVSPRYRLVFLVEMVDKLEALYWQIRRLNQRHAKAVFAEKVKEGDG